MHFPGHDYLGPGTKGFTKEPVDIDDQIAKEHDLDYIKAKSSEDIRKADHKAIKNASIHSLIGPTRLSAKYLTESITSVLYPHMHTHYPTRRGKRENWTHACLSQSAECLSCL